MTFADHCVVLFKSKNTYSLCINIVFKFSFFLLLCLLQYILFDRILWSNKIILQTAVRARLCSIIFQLLRLVPPFPGPASSVALSDT